MYTSSHHMCIFALNVTLVIRISYMYTILLRVYYVYIYICLYLNYTISMLILSYLYLYMYIILLYVYTYSPIRRLVIGRLTAAVVQVVTIKMRLQKVYILHHQLVETVHAMIIIIIHIIVIIHIVVVIHLHRHILHPPIINKKVIILTLSKAIMIVVSVRE